jgi:hypothetical protein
MRMLKLSIVSALVFVVTACGQNTQESKENSPAPEGRAGAQGSPGPQARPVPKGRPVPKVLLGLRVLVAPSPACLGLFKAHARREAAPCDVKTTKSWFLRDASH